MLRFIQIRDAKSHSIMICDTKYTPLYVLCTCDGWRARDNADAIVDALNYYNDSLYNRFKKGEEHGAG